MFWEHDSLMNQTTMTTFSPPTEMEAATASLLAAVAEWVSTAFECKKREGVESLHPKEEQIMINAVRPMSSVCIW